MMSFPVHIEHFVSNNFTLTMKTDEGRGRITFILVPYGPLLVGETYSSQRMTTRVSGSSPTVRHFPV